MNKSKEYVNGSQAALKVLRNIARVHNKPYPEVFYSASGLHVVYEGAVGLRNVKGSGI